MKSDISKAAAKEKIESFFKKEHFSSKEVRKIKRLAMKYKLKLSTHRKKFCKKCLSQLKGKTRLTKTHKSIECKSCKFINKFKIN
jgi:RNase P subunit RPR2